MTSYPTWAAGDKITSAKLTAMQTQYVIAASTQSLTSSTTMQNDNELVFPLEANATYEVEVYALFQQADATGTGDLVTDYTFPSGSSGLKQCLGPSSVAGAATGREQMEVRLAAHAFGTDVDYLFGADENLDYCVWERGVITTSTTAGNFQFRWAQKVADADALTRDASSYMKVTRIA